MLLLLLPVEVVEPLGNEILLDVFVRVKSFEPDVTHLNQRLFDAYAATLASLTGWNIDTIRSRMSLAPLPAQRWWESLWPANR